MASSGLCLFSSMVGGRSGNRGACAQPCRMEYEARGAASCRGCLLSPKDLMTAPLLGKLTNAGVSSLKIEGRLKKPEYVAVVTSAY
ncbi:MAG: U32 family peptidase, partial [Clostridia bacterium]|nr:U32 family peptidase [Clostridia bacterium]